MKHPKSKDAASSRTLAASSRPHGEKSMNAEHIRRHSDPSTHTSTHTEHL